jgi:hypothetical protein
VLELERGQNSEKEWGFRSDRLLIVHWPLVTKQQTEVTRKHASIKVWFYVPVTFLVHLKTNLPHLAVCFCAQASGSIGLAFRHLQPPGFRGFLDIITTTYGMLFSRIVSSFTSTLPHPASWSYLQGLPLHNFSGQSRRCLFQIIPSF